MDAHTILFCGYSWLLKRRLLSVVMKEASGTVSRLAMEPATATPRNASVRKKTLRVSSLNLRSLDRLTIAMFLKKKKKKHHRHHNLLFTQRLYVMTCARPSSPQHCSSPSSFPSSCPRTSSTVTTKTHPSLRSPLPRWLSEGRPRLTPSVSLQTTCAAVHRNPLKPTPLKYPWAFSSLSDFSKAFCQTH